jgi:hypothetical protein
VVAITLFQKFSPGWICLNQTINLPYKYTLAKINPSFVELVKDRTKPPLEHKVLHRTDEGPYETQA